MDKQTKDWWSVSNETGVTGLVPVSYLEVIREDTVQQQQPEVRVDVQYGTKKCTMSTYSIFKVLCTHCSDCTCTVMTF